MILFFIDCPPSLGQAVTAASLSADYIIVPVDPERFSLSGLNVTLQELERNVAEKFEVNLNVKIVLNKFDGRTSLSHKVLTALFNDSEYQKRLFKTFIRTNQELPNSVSKGKSIFDSIRASSAKEDIDLLSREFIELTKIENTLDAEKKSSMTMHHVSEGA
ncbi:ParA family protein [Rickettsiella massiliensis]|uniref:ParA family protein n=1 Tax=Rickettsiella massiliensis TaxID=676517 RepID=UPI0003154B65|nr:ParA family protein [Rickettsiella massiliensis]